MFFKKCREKVGVNVQEKSKVVNKPITTHGMYMQLFFKVRAFRGVWSHDVATV